MNVNPITAFGNQPMSQVPPAAPIRIYVEMAEEPAPGQSQHSVGQPFGSDNPYNYNTPPQGAQRPQPQMGQMSSYNYGGPSAETGTGYNSNYASPGQQSGTMDSGSSSTTSASSASYSSNGLGSSYSSPGSYSASGNNNTGSTGYGGENAGYNSGQQNQTYGGGDYNFSTSGAGTSGTGGSGTGGTTYGSSQFGNQIYGASFAPQYPFYNADPQGNYYAYPPSESPEARELAQDINQDVWLDVPPREQMRQGSDNLSIALAQARQDLERMENEFETRLESLQRGYQREVGNMSNNLEQDYNRLIARGANALQTDESPYRQPSALSSLNGYLPYAKLESPYHDEWAMSHNENGDDQLSMMPTDSPFRSGYVAPTYDAADPWAANQQASQPKDWMA